MSLQPNWMNPWTQLAFQYFNLTCVVLSPSPLNKALFTRAPLLASAFPIPPSLP